MTDLDRYFEKDVEPLPSRVRAWMEFKKQAGGPVEAELQQERDGLLPKKPKVALRFLSSTGGLKHFDEQPWELPFERWLLDEERVRYKNPGGDVLRFYLLLSEAFKPIVRDVGATYFEAALVTRLRRPPFNGPSELSDVLVKAPSLNPSETYLAGTLADIDAAIGSVGKRVAPAYNNVEERRDLLIGGLARYVDELFHISARKSLFGP